MNKKGILNNNSTDPNKILPMKYKWARKHYKDGVANNWTPDEVSMQKDIETWKAPKGLSDDERRLILWNMGFFSTAESLTANNIVLAIYRHITNPECRQYLLRQAYEEAIHTDTFIYCCDSLGLDPDEVYNMYNTIPSIKDKDDFVIEMTKSIFDDNFKTDSPENIQRFVHDLVGYYIIMEGIFFYAGFVMILSFLRQNRMTGLAEQFQYILRDESVHLAFGADLINTIVEENPEIWTTEIATPAKVITRTTIEVEEQTGRSTVTDKQTLYQITPLTGGSMYLQYTSALDTMLTKKLPPGCMYQITYRFPFGEESFNDIYGYIEEVNIRKLKE